MYHHVGLPSHQNQNPTPTFVPPQAVPPSYPTHNYQQQPQYSYSHPVETIQNTENSQKGMEKFFEASRKMRASCVALKASCQHLCDLLKKRRENLAKINNHQEPKLELQQSTKGGSVEVQLPLVEAEFDNIPNPSLHVEVHLDLKQQCDTSVVLPKLPPQQPPEKILAKPLASKPPPEPPDLKSPSEIISTPPPANRPPSKPPDAPPVLLIAQSQPPVPPLSTKPLSLPKPLFNCPPLRPPCKPPDLESPPGEVLSQLQFSSPFCYLSLRKCVEFLSLKSSTIKIKYQPFDLHFVSVIQSQPCNKSTIHVRLHHPTICRQVTSQMQLSPP
jgi:hypothetical protein